MTLICHNMHRVSPHTQTMAPVSHTLSTWVAHVMQHDVPRCYTRVLNPGGEKEHKCGPPPPW